MGRFRLLLLGLLLVTLGSMVVPLKSGSQMAVKVQSQPSVSKVHAIDYRSSQLSPSIYLPFFRYPALDGIWVDRERISSLPTDGAAWDQLLLAVLEDTSSPDIRDQDDDTDIFVLAKALVYARIGDERYRQEVVDSLMKVIGTEQGGRTLALGRNLVGYVIAADLVKLSLDEEKDQLFRSWLNQLLSMELDGRTLQNTHEERPNNWGTHAGAARAAIAVYLGNSVELARTAQVFKGYLGDRSAYSEFLFGDLSWQCDPVNPVGINPAGCLIDGHQVDGVLTDDQRRGGEFEWPPPQEGYVWEGLQGAIVQAQILHRAGYQAWEWEDRALLRAVRWLHEQAGFPAEGDDEWQPWLINAVYGTDFPTVFPARYGKNMGWTDWTAAIQP